MTGLRVALFGNFLSGSLGGRSVCEDLADRLESRGVAVVRASTSRNAARRLLDMLGTAAAMRRRYDVAYVDVYSGRGLIWAECVSLLLRMLRKPFILMLRGGRLPEFSREHPRRMRRLLASARFVVAPSHYLADAMSGFCHDVVVLPNAVDIDAYRGRVREAASPRLVWLRSFHKIYNPSLAVTVFALIAAKHTEATLVMAGPDRGDGTLAAAQAEARRLGVADRIEMPGNVRKAGIPALLDRHDVFLNTANIDNAPISVIEAMASGLCVVTTNVGGIPALCRHGQHAMLVPPGDADAMAAACMALMDNPALARRLSAGALEEAKVYDLELMVDRWATLLWSAKTPR